MIERSKYILKVLKHLSDTSTYQQLSNKEVEHYITQTHDEISHWREKYDLYLDKAKKLYLKSNCTSALPYFYMTIKAHKNLARILRQKICPRLTTLCFES